MAYVYLLNTYGEYGPENMVATLDRGEVPRILEKNWKVDPEQEEGLGVLLSRSDEDLALHYSPTDLGFGWGGVQFSVVKLTESNEER